MKHLLRWSRLPAPWVGLRATYFPFLAARVQLQHRNFSGLAAASTLEEEHALLEKQELCSFTPARHSWESWLSPPPEVNAPSTRHQTPI